MSERVLSLPKRRTAVPGPGRGAQGCAHGMTRDAIENLRAVQKVADSLVKILKVGVVVHRSPIEGRTLD